MKPKQLYGRGPAMRAVKALKADLRKKMRAIKHGDGRKGGRR